VSSPEYKINSIFRSIQGEGAFTGWPALFVRFQGCNLNCPFCDTKDAIPVDKGKVFSLKELASAIALMARKHDLIVLTGGEPTLQNLDPLIERILQKGDWPIHLETNGTQSIPWDIDWLVLSPKFPAPVFKANVYRANEIKWLIGVEGDVDALVEWMEPFGLPPAVFAVQPISQGKEATRIAYEAAMRYGFRLSIQVHKYIGVE